MTTRVIDLFLDPGNHAARPAAAAVPVGSLYPCSDHGVERNDDGSTWSLWDAATAGLDDAAIAALINDDTTPSDVRAALDALYAGGGGAVSSVNAQTGAVVLDQDDIADGTTAKQYTATEKTKLAGIATGATANSADATLLDRANHTGSPSTDVAMGTHKITGLQDATANDHAVNKGQMDTAIAAGGGGGGVSQVDTYITAQSATALAAPVGATWCDIDVQAAGGGGGSGRKGITTVGRSGGSGGGRGGRHVVRYNVADLPSTLYVWVGAAGTGGASQTTNSTSGSAGVDGGDSFVSTSSSGTLATAKAASVAVARGGNGGNAGTTTTSSGASGGWGEGDSPAGGTGGNSSTTTGGAQATSGGGGGGGSISSSNSVNNAGDTYAGTTANAANATGWRLDAPAGAGADGIDASTATGMTHGPVPGLGGTGGKGSTAGNAGRGGHGIYGGGGGGGGAASDSVGDSGAGGNGGAGYVKVTWS